MESLSAVITEDEAGVFLLVLVLDTDMTHCPPDLRYRRQRTVLPEGLFGNLRTIHRFTSK
eukprot:1882363-Rhodomonas_salina.2